MPPSCSSDAHSIELAANRLWPIPDSRSRLRSPPVEPDQAGLGRRLFEPLGDFRFLPGGHIPTGADVATGFTLVNGFLMGIVGDDLDATLEMLLGSMVTLSCGGGISCNFSTAAPGG